MSFKKLIAILLIPVLQGASVYWVFSEHYCLDQMACGMENEEVVGHENSCCETVNFSHKKEKKEDCSHGESLHLTLLSNISDHHLDSDCCRDELKVYQPVIQDVLPEEIDFSLVLAPVLMPSFNQFAFINQFLLEETLRFIEAPPTLVGNSIRQSLLGVYLC